MKIEYVNEKVIVYLYKYKLSFNNVEKLNNEIRTLFIKLIKKYQLNFFGYSKVDIYENKKYGSILEINKIYNNDFNNEIIDLKLVVHQNSPFYIKFDNYYFFIPQNILISKKNNFYINIDNVDSILKYLEFGKIIYNEKDVFNL